MGRGFLSPAPFTGGAGNNTNLVAMKHEGGNAYHTGTWGKMEKKWAEALKKGEPVSVEVI